MRPCPDEILRHRRADCARDCARRFSRPMAPLPAAFGRGEANPPRCAVAARTRTGVLGEGGGNSSLQRAAVAREFASVGRQGSGAHSGSRENRPFCADLGKGSRGPARRRRARPMRANSASRRRASSYSRNVRSGCGRTCSAGGPLGRPVTQMTVGEWASGSRARARSDGLSRLPRGTLPDRD